MPEVQLSPLLNAWDARYAEMPLPRLYRALAEVYGELKASCPRPWGFETLAKYDWFAPSIFECRYCMGWIDLREGVPATELLPKDQDILGIIAETTNHIDRLLQQYYSRPPTDFWTTEGECPTREDCKKRDIAYFRSRRNQWKKHHARCFAIVHNAEAVTFIEGKEEAIAYAELNFPDSIVLVAKV